MSENADAQSKIKLFETKDKTLKHATKYILPFRPK